MACITIAHGSMAGTMSKRVRKTKDLPEPRNIWQGPQIHALGDENLANILGHHYDNITRRSPSCEAATPCVSPFPEPDQVGSAADNTRTKMFSAKTKDADAR
jgi:hypothetical protein